MSTGNALLLNVTEAAELIGVSESFVYKHMQAGDIPAVRIGRLKKYRRKDLEAYIEKNLVGAV